MFKVQKMSALYYPVAENGENYDRTVASSLLSLQRESESTEEENQRGFMIMVFLKSSWRPIIFATCKSF